MAVLVLQYAENTDVLFIFLSMDSMLGTFIGYFFGTLGNKASIIFSGTAFFMMFFRGASCRFGLL